MKEDQDNIEQFFSKRLSNQSFDFDEDQWDALSKKLDEDEGSGALIYSSSNRIRLIASALLVLCIAFAFFLLGWYLKPDNGNTEGIEKNSSPELITVEDHIAFDTEACEEGGDEYDDACLAEDYLNNYSEKPKGVNNTRSNLNNKDNKVSKIKVIPKPINQSGINDNLENDSDQRPSLENRIDELTNRASESTESVSDDNYISIVDNDDIYNNTINDLNSKILVKKTENNVSNGPYLDYLNMIAVDMPSLEIVSPFIIMQSVTLKEDSLNETNEEELSKWGVVLFVAPDFNSTSFSELYKSLGQAVGIRLEYYMFKERLKLDLGATLGNKVYVAEEGDYTPIPGFWVDGIAPNETDAQCLTLDVPINLGYCLMSKGPQNIWINTGISSYWMLTENYQYFYDVPNPEGRQQWVGERESFHLAGAWDISITYERRLTEKFWMILEPYYKSPLEGIGHGSVELLSSGINIGLKYRGVKSKN